MMARITLMYCMLRIGAAILSLDFGQFGNLCLWLVGRTLVRNRKGKVKPKRHLRVVYVIVATKICQPLDKEKRRRGRKQCK
jgi:hypothetical protein